MTYREKIKVYYSQSGIARNSYENKSWWSVEPNVGRVVNGTPFRVDRIKALGNGVVPLQVKTAFEKLMGLEFKPEVE